MQCTRKTLHLQLVAAGQLLVVCGKLSWCTSKVCGGYCGPSKLRSAERFDILEGSWEKLPTMLEVGRLLKQFKQCNT